MIAVTIQSYVYYYFYAVANRVNASLGSFLRYMPYGEIDLLSWLHGSLIQCIHSSHTYTPMYFFISFSRRPGMMGLVSGFEAGILTVLLTNPLWVINTRQATNVQAIRNSQVQVSSLDLSSLYCSLSISRSLDLSFLFYRDKTTRTYTHIKRVGWHASHASGERKE